MWEHLKQTLLGTLEARRVQRPRKGRPAKGPGSAQLGGSPVDRARVIREAYEEIRGKGHEPQYVEVARKLALSPTTLWRWRQQNGWPPPEVESL